mmetsp:Transcript_14396/g.18074  ORF Transcript_14396/g.18074 Transcript_14396/m.18074 type:complete len:1392 (+) Transcript_14396:339-4514(+)
MATKSILFVLFTLGFPFLIHAASIQEPGIHFEPNVFYLKLFFEIETDVSNFSYSFVEFENDCPEYVPTSCCNKYMKWENSSYPVTCDIVEHYANATFDGLDFCNISDYKSTLLHSASAEQKSACLEQEEAMSLVACFFNSTDECAITCETPEVTDVQFNTYGTTLTISFDQETNFGGYPTGIFDCSELMDFDGVDEVQCKWINSHTLHVGVTGGLTLTVQDTVMLKGGLFAAKNHLSYCGTSHALNQTTLTLVAPTDAASPIVVFGSISQLYDSCVDVTIDASGSMVGCSPTYFWELEDTSMSNTTVLSNFLSNETESSVTIENSILDKGKWYAIRLTVTNCLGKNHSDVANFSLASVSVPSLSIDGGFSHSIYTYNALSLTARGAASDCGGTSCTTALTYDWAIIGFPQLEFSASLNTFTLPSGSLNSSSTYYIRSKVTDCTGAVNDAIVTVTTLSADLVASIAGGSSRTISELYMFKLISTSYDPDGGNINHYWNCTDSTSSPCGMNVTGLNDILVVKAGELEDDDSREPYTVTLVVSAQNDDRTMATSQKIYVESEAVPSISISTTDMKLNPSVDNTITARIDTTDGDVTATWSVGDESSAFMYGNSLNPNVRGPTHKSYSESSFNGLATYNLVLKAGAIDTSGSEYTLVLTAEFDSGASSFATYTFVSNEAPSPGMITVSPEEGYELQTVFEACLTGGVDSDSPLSYSLFYKTNPSSSNLQTIQATSYSNCAEGFYLPEGNIYIIGYVTDFLGAESEIISDKVEVSVSAYSVANLTNIVSNAIDSAFVDGDYDLIASTLSALTSAIVDDSIDCDGASASLCQSYNRANCSETANTCGECLDGYEGYDGDANSQCVSTEGCSVNGEVDGDETDVDCGGSDCAPCELGSDCSADSDCESNNCYDGECIEQPKSCPTSQGLECNGYGTCYYKHKQSGKEKTASWCGASNPLCVAYCVCDATYTGESCDMTDAEVQAALDALNLVFEQVSTVLDTLGDDISSNDIDTYASILSSSSGDAELFDESTAASSLSVLSAIIPSADAEVVISETAAASMLGAISNLFDFIFLNSGERRLMSLAHRHLLTDTETTLASSSLKLCRNLVSGTEEGFVTDIVEDQIQLTYGSYYGADLCAFIDQAQSDSQADAGLALSGVKFCDDLVDDQIYELCTMTFFSTDLPDSTISSVYLIDADEREDDDRRLTSEENIIKIAFYEEIEWEEETTLSDSGSCPTTTEYGTDTACGGYTVSCSDDYSAYQLECVSNSTYPSCLSYDNVTDTYETCTTLNYTSLAVFCDCGTSSGQFIAESVKVIGGTPTVTYTEQTDSDSETDTASETDTDTDGADDTSTDSTDLGELTVGPTVSIQLNQGSDGVKLRFANWNSLLLLPLLILLL